MLTRLRFFRIISNKHYPIDIIHQGNVVKLSNNQLGGIIQLQARAELLYPQSSCRFGGLARLQLLTVCLSTRSSENFVFANCTAYMNSFVSALPANSVQCQWNSVKCRRARLTMTIIRSHFRGMNLKTHSLFYYIIARRLETFGNETHTEGESQESEELQVWRQAQMSRKSISIRQFKQSPELGWCTSR